MDPCSRSRSCQTSRGGARPRARAGQPLRAGHVAHPSPSLASADSARGRSKSGAASRAQQPQSSVHLIGRRPGGGDRPAGAPRGGCGVLGLLTRAVPRKEGSSLLENLAPHRTSATACGSSAKCDLRLHRGRQEMATACRLRRQHAAPNAGHPDWRWPRQHVEEATARLAEERRPQHVLRPESTLRPAPRIGDRPDAATCPRTKGRGSGRRARREASQPQPRASRARSCLQHAPLAFFGCPVCSSWR